ncbi:MAG: 3-dehydroquinate synthase [Clostridiales bacterium]|nr:3-dehydroquinate synthase [Clostridiales bacterium]
MKKLHVSASREYDIIIGSGLIKSVKEILGQCTSARKFMIVSDDNVFPLYGKTLISELLSDGKSVYSHVIPHGESSKSPKHYIELLDALAENRFDRSDCIIALGGGVVGDLSGFAAATYKRGLELVQMPTTLLAAVDASVGGKTAINLKQGKNLAGCFYQPNAVIIDTDTLATLPDKEYTGGCAEVIKYGMIADKELLSLTASVPVKSDYEDFIFRCADIKRGFIERDERDTGCRMLLNFGHTLGHSFEKLSSYTLPHGFAVAVGMAYITRAAFKMGFCQSETLYALLDALEACRLPKHIDYPSSDIALCAMNDKKEVAGEINLIVPIEIGKCEILKVPTSELIIWVKAGEADA